ncbi:MAG TPA: LytTR family DNA-binding domain-containing protein [Flavipsychrobacter sp.]|nr:LytTR family DNA-binding domain-containing protein [Flavipsychrobacter sp.]
MQNNFTCIVVDDEPDAIEMLTDSIKGLSANMAIIGTYTSWKEALVAMRQQNTDILFLDISMPGKNGIDLLKLMPDIESEIIFTTAYSEYAVDAFKFSATGYLLKPIDDAELMKAVNKAIERIKYKKAAKKENTIKNVDAKIGIPNNKGIDYVSMSDIIYLESVNKCTKIITKNSQFLSSFNIGRFRNITEHSQFFQVHRSFIVNVNYVVRYESTGNIIMTNNKEVPVSRNVKEEFLSLFNTINSSTADNEE